MKQPTRNIFVLMPFDTKFDNIFFSIQQAAKALDATVERADNPITSEAILQRVYRGIDNAHLVLADLTNHNPNVFYEVGYAHAIGKPVAFLAPSIRDVPFDLQAYPILSYSTETPVRDLVEQMSEHLKMALERAEDTSSLRKPIEIALRNLRTTTVSSPLFKSLLQSRLERFASEVGRWSNGILKVSPGEAIEKGIVVLKHLREGGFATFFVPVESYWLTESEYFDATRRAAKGARIQRVFIIFEPRSLESPDLKECILKDKAAGIETLICSASRVADQEAIKDFGIWDDEILCLMEVANVGSTSTVTGCMFSIDHDDLSKARRWRENILRVAEPADQALLRYEESLRHEQPLALSAPIMLEHARTLCKGSYLGLGDCAWYHGSWQYLRRIDLVSTPDWHREFYADAVGSVLSENLPPRILICGTADYCMLSHVHRALSAKADQQVEIVVTDACPTPLKICEWFANRSKFRIRTILGDALSLDFRDGWFAAVISDAFLTRFSADKRLQVISEWRRILSPAGYVITTVRIDPDSKMTAGREEIKRFASRARAGAAQAALLNSSEIYEMAQIYASKIVSYSVASAEDLYGMFSGFASEIELADTPGEINPTRYARVRAIKKP